MKSGMVVVQCRSVPGVVCLDFTSMPGSVRCEGTVEASSVHCNVLFFCFNDVRVIQHSCRTMLMFPSLDNVRTAAYAILYATIYVRDTTLCTDNSASFCTGNMLARNKRPGFAHYCITLLLSHTRCCAVCVCSETRGVKGF